MMNLILQISKKIVLTISLIISGTLMAQSGINYQGVVRDVQGELIVEEEIELEVNIKKTIPEGTIVYSELHTVTTDVNGVFSIVIGNGTATAIPYDSVNWSEDKHFLNVLLNGADIGTTEFASVPYAYAIGKWQAHNNGVTPKGTGGSIYIGGNSGLNDNFDNNHNIGIGENTLKNNQSFNNIAIGDEALMSNVSGWNNIALGAKTLVNNADGNYNIALGVTALNNNISGNYNISVGGSALRNNTEGNHNIANGYHALMNNTTGNNNQAVGFEALYSNTVGSNNLAFGYQALRSSVSGYRNIGMGYKALFSNTTGNENIAIGHLSQTSNQDGTRNISIGKYSLNDNVNSSSNIVIGVSALHNLISGGDNVAIGDSTLKMNITGSSNTAIGYYAGFRNKGDNNVFIGAHAGEDGFFNNLSNILVIDNANLSNPLIYGEFDNRVLGFGAKVGIGTKTPNVPLQISTGTDVDLTLGSGVIVVGEELGTNLAIDSNEIQARNAGLASSLYLQQNGGNVYVGNAIVHSSDRRLKHSIEDISYGLDAVLKLRPKEYFWKGKTQDEKSLGLIAQQVEDVIKNVVTYNTEQDKYGVSYTELIPVLIKALQEQQDIINKQNQTINGFENRLSALEGKLGSN